MASLSGPVPSTPPFHLIKCLALHTGALSDSLSSLARGTSPHCSSGSSKPCLPTHSQHYPASGHRLLQMTERAFDFRLLLPSVLQSTHKQESRDTDPKSRRFLGGVLDVWWGKKGDFSAYAAPLFTLPGQQRGVRWPRSDDFRF